MNKNEKIFLRNILLVIMLNFIVLSLFSISNIFEKFPLHDKIVTIFIFSGSVFNHIYFYNNNSKNVVILASVIKMLSLFIFFLYMKLLDWLFGYQKIFPLFLLFELSSWVIGFIYMLENYCKTLGNKKNRTFRDKPNKETFENELQDSNPKKQGKRVRFEAA